MTTYPLKGHDYPLAMTLRAMALLDKEYGGVENMEGIFADKSVAEVLETCVGVLSALMRGGYDYCVANGDEAVEPPAKEAIAALVFPKDAPAIKSAIFAAMTESMTPDVKAKASKNVEATSGE